MKDIDKKVKIFPIDKVRNVAAEYLTVFKNRVKSGKDANDNQFPPYSKGYAKYKAHNMRRFRDGQRLAGLKGVAITSNNIANPDFVLRGITLKTTGIKKVLTDSFEFGWDGEPAAIVEGNASRGRDIISDIPDREYNWILNKLGVIIEDQFKKLNDVVITIRS